MVNVVPREVQRPKPSILALDTPFTMIPPRLFQIMSHYIFECGGEGEEGSAGYWSQSLGFFFHAPNLFVCLQEAPKHILFSLLTPCITCFPSYLAIKISPLNSFLSKVVRLLVCVFMVEISLKFYKICLMPYSTILSIKNIPSGKKKP